MKILANKPVFILFVVLILGIPISAAIYYVIDKFKDEPILEIAVAPNTSNLNPRLMVMKSNTWMKLASPWSSNWHRQKHAGIANNSNTGNLLLFGSDTHDENWDNAVHRFSPTKEKWTTDYVRSGQFHYQLDKNNYATTITNKQTRPWAMHTFDNIAYDPKHNSLLVTSTPEHNPISKKFTDEIHPMWQYDLATKSWAMFKNNGKPMPKIFAGATEYDPDRDTFVAYKFGIWELGPERKQWIKASKENHHDIHFNMEYDKRNKRFVVFGNSKLTNTVWSYAPGATAGAKGKWEKHLPQGDIPPKDQHFPVAYDSDNGLFFLMVHNYKVKTLENGEQKQIRMKTATGYVYDPSKNQYTKIPNSEIPLDKINYMMAYNEEHKVFLLVTGDWDSSPTVWALKLDISQLNKQKKRRAKLPL